MGDDVFWQGTDKVLELARAFPDWQFDLIGMPRSHTEGNVTAHGFLGRRAVRADPGAGRSGARDARAAPQVDGRDVRLKVGLYLAYGLPVVIGYDDSNLAGVDAWYLLRLPNEESNVRDNLARIASFAQAVKGRRVQRGEVADRISVTAKEADRLAFFESVLRPVPGPSQVGTGRADELHEATVLPLMRILFITPTLGLGGSERLTVGYAAGLKQRGHEVAIAFGIKNRHSVATEKAGIPTYEVARMFPTRESVREWVGNLRRVVQELQPDVIHAQSVATAAIARLAAPRTPMLVTMHGVPTDDEAAAALALRATFAHVTAVSSATADGLRRYPWSPGIDVLHAGVDIAKLESDSVTYGPVELIGSPKLCCVARQMPQKGIDVLLRTLTHLAEELPEVGLTLVGDGNDLEQNKLLARELGLGDRTHFTGGVRTRPRTCSRPTRSSSRPAGKGCRWSCWRPSRWRGRWSRPRSTARRRCASTARRAGSCRRTTRRHSQPRSWTA